MTLILFLLLLVAIAVIVALLRRKPVAPVPPSPYARDAAFGRPDPAWGENGAMGDVPAGHYYLIGTVNGESFRAEFDVYPGQTTFVEIRTSQ